MQKRGGGSVVTLTYLGSERVFPNYNVMGVAKAALETSVRYLAARPRAEEHPGQRGFGRSDQDAGGRWHLRLFQHPAGVSRRAPLRRNVELGEVADAALFLLSPASRAITGEVLMVDAGYSVIGLYVERLYLLPRSLRTESRV